VSYPALRVLVVVEDPGAARAIASVIREEGDEVEVVSTLADGVAKASSVKLDLAFVDLRSDDGAALALCHHLPGLHPPVVVHAIVAPDDLERGAEAMSLGAQGVILSPATGDALARALSDLKAERARHVQVDRLEEKLTRERKRLETYDRLVRFARGAAQSDAVRTIVDGVAQLSGARGVALYATYGGNSSERVRLAATGTALDIPASASSEDLAQLVHSRQARLVPLATAAGEIGLLFLDQTPDAPESEISALADLAAAMLALVDRRDHDGDGDDRRVFAPRQFRTVAERMLSLAGRHDRRASVLAISVPEGGRPSRADVAREVAELVRTTDALSGSEADDLLLFLPETTGLGGHVCRRRILARLAGDRRARPQGNVARSHDPRSRRAPVSIGVATFPHDGETLKRLIRAARARAADDARSPVHALSLDTLSLADVVDALIARPIFDAGARSPYPLDVACPALFSLVMQACRDAARGGVAAVTTSLQPGLGVAAAARQVTTPRVHDVRSETGCENVDAIVIEAEHGSWVCCGRLIGERFRGVHAADPLLADVIAQRLSVGGVHAG
jgi:CheY-like chemotaxis protein